MRQAPVIVVASRHVGRRVSQFRKLPEADGDHGTMRAPHLIALAGPTCSGKSTLARVLVERLGRNCAACLSMDSYYRDLAGIPIEERGRRNFDAPEAFDWPLLQDHVTRLARGLAIDVPIYDFVTHSRMPHAQPLDPRDYIVMEGLLVLHDDTLRRLWTTTVYVDLPADVCLLRRLKRDVIERGRTEESVRNQFEASVAPMMDRYIVPARDFAMLVIDGQANPESSVDQVLSQISEREKSRL